MKTRFLIIIAALSLSLFSCQNFDSNPVETNDEVLLKSTEIATTDIHMESLMEEVSHEGEMLAEYEHILRRLSKISGKKVFDGEWGKGHMADSGVEVTIDTSENRYPVIITLDYGEGTELKNGRIVSGILMIEISAPRDTDGATRTINYMDMTVDTVGVDGVCVHTFNGDNESTRLMLTSSEVTFTLPDGTTVDRVGAHERNWLAGLETPKVREDDEIEVTGSVALSSSTGDVWSKTIIETILRTGDCRHPVSGVVQIVYNDEVSSEIDFGDGDCDNLALLTVDGEQVEIELQGPRPKAKEGNNGSKGKKKSRN